MKPSPYILFVAVFVWLYVPEIAGYKITIADRARTMEVNLRWVREKYDNENYLLVKLISRRASEVPTGINFHMRAIYQVPGCRNLKLTCKTTLRRPINRVRLVRENLECTKWSFTKCKTRGGCLPKHCQKEPINGKGPKKLKL